MNLSIISIMLVLLVGALVGGLDFTLFNELSQTLNQVNQSLNVNR